MRKRHLLFGLAGLLGAVPSVAQRHATVQTAEPLHIEVAFYKTVHILFPSAVRYVDLGSLDLVAGKADGADNIVRIKAAVQGFESETNFSVITEDGNFYTFEVGYSENPSRLSVIVDELLENRKGTCGEQQRVRLKELGAEDPAQVERIMSAIYCRNTRECAIGSQKFGIQATLRGIFIHNDLMYFHTAIRNRSNITYDIELFRFMVVDKKVARRTAIQQTIIEPVRMLNGTRTVPAKSTRRNVFVFPKITIPDDKVLTVEIIEKDGGRHQRYIIDNNDLVKALTFEESQKK